MKTMITQMELNETCFHNKSANSCFYTETTRHFGLIRELTKKTGVILVIIIKTESTEKYNSNY